jgi:lipopolysaccharide/colanic/teichoic acid biosynthesis glycosyltransferase
MPRMLDLLLSLIGLILLSPIFTIISLLVKMSSNGPVFFLQKRIGQGGREFTLIKFRTMSVGRNAENGGFDIGDKSRVTAIGKILRKTKIDELPQLINVIVGEMALVGPRPEVRKWVDAYPNEWAYIHTIKPGITDPASIAYRNEELILCESPDPTRMYREIVLPHKLSLYKEYVQERTFHNDINILWATFLALFKRA